MNEIPPICLNILDIDYSKDTPEFEKVETIVFLGANVPKDIQKHIIQYNPKKSPPVLKKYYGTKWKQYLHIMDTKKGGVDDDEFEDLTLDDLVYKTVEKSDKLRSIVTKKKKKYEITYNFTTTFFKEDNLQTFKEKLSIATDIPYLKQHVFFQSSMSHLYFTIGYDIILDNNKYDINITKIDFADIGSILLSIPIDRYIHSMYESTSIHVDETTTNIMRYLDVDSLGEFSVISIDSFISYQNIKENIHHLIKVDKEQYDLIYTSFVYKYFPIFTETLFFEYITNESSLTDSYPDVMVPKKILAKRYELEKDIMNELDSVSDKELKENRELFKTRINKISIRSNSVYSDDIVSIKTLFNNIELSSIPFINFIEMMTHIGREETIITKINTLTSMQYNHSYYEKNTLFLSIFVVDEKNDIFKFSNVFMNMVLDSKGIIKIYIQFPTIIILNKSAFTKLIVEKVNPIIHKLNKIDIAFSTSHRILPITEETIIYMDTSISLVYNKMISLKVLESIFEKYIDANIFQFKSSVDEHEYMLYKGIFSYNLSKLNTTYYDVQNQYSRFSDIQFKNMWNHLFSNKTIVIKYNIINTTFELNNITMQENEYIKDLLNRLLIVYKRKLILAESNALEANTIQSLKSIDPKLFNFKARSNYSRVCQKKFQPKIITPDEIRKKNLKNVVKYWNFTKNKEEYYYCPYTKNKYIGFITNVHPNKYCLPCCKKIHREDEKYKSCTNTYQYDESKKKEVQTSRYIPHYSFDADIGDRLTELPLSLSKVLNSQSSDTIYIYGYVQQRIKDKYIGMVDIFAQIMDVSIQEYIMMILRYLKETPNTFDLIFHALPHFPFNSLPDLIKSITHTFTTNKLDMNETMVDWNIIFISIMYYYGYNTLIFEDNSLNQSSERIEMVLHQTQISKDIILKNSNTVLVFRKSINKSNDYLYYPLFTIHKQRFFSFREIEKKMVKREDILYTVLENMVNIHFSELNKSYNKTLNLQNIIAFIDSTKIYKLVDLYVYNNECYAVGLVKNNSYMYLSIHNSSIEAINLNAYTLIYKPLDIKKYKSQIKMILDFISHYNKYVLHTAKVSFTSNELQDKLRIYKAYNQTYNLSILKSPNQCLFDIDLIDLNLDFLYISKFILHQNNVIGVTHNNLITYIQPPISVQAVKTILKSNINKIKTNVLCKSQKDIEQLLTRVFYLHTSMTKDILINVSNAINEEYKIFFKELIYHPLKINLIIEEKKNSSFLDKKKRDLLQKSTYNRYIYKIFIYLFAHSIKVRENKKIRDDIIKYIKKLKKEQFLTFIDYSNSKYSKDIIDIIHSYIKKTFKIDEFLVENIADTSLKTLLHLINLNKVEILSKFKDIESTIKILLFNNEFLFDMIALEEIKYMELHNLKQVIERYTKPHIHISSSIPYSSEPLMKNIEERITSKEESMFFYNKKLILSSKTYKEFIDILSFDISNPFKRRLILSNVFFKTPSDLVSFHQFINEKIFINYL